MSASTLLVELRARRDELQDEVRHLQEAEAEWKTLEAAIATTTPTPSSSSTTHSSPTPIAQQQQPTASQPPSVVVGDAATEDVLDKVVRGMTTYSTDGAYPHWACWPLLQPSRVQAYASCFDLSGNGTPLIRVDDVWRALRGDTTTTPPKHDITRCYSRGFYEPLSSPLSWAKTAVCGRSVPYTADAYDAHRKAEAKRLKQLKKAGKEDIPIAPALPTSHMTLSVSCESKAALRHQLPNVDGDRVVSVVQLMGIHWKEHSCTTDMVSFRGGVQAATDRVKARIIESYSTQEDGGGDVTSSTSYLCRLVRQLTASVVVTPQHHDVGQTTTATHNGDEGSIDRVYVVLSGPVDLLCAIRDPTTHMWQAPAASIIRHWVAATEQLVASNKTTAIPSLMLLLKGLATTYDPFTMTEEDMKEGVPTTTTSTTTNDGGGTAAAADKDARKQKHSHQRLKNIAGFFSSSKGASSAVDEGDVHKQVLAESMPIFFQGMAACGALLDLSADLPMLFPNEPIASVLERAAQEVCTYYDDGGDATITTPPPTLPTWKFDITNVPLKYWLKWVSIKQKLEREKGGPGRAARSAAAASVSVGLNLYSRLMLHCYRPTYTAIKKMCPTAAAAAHDMLGMAKGSMATLIASGVEYIRTLSARSKVDSPMLSEVVRGMTSGVKNNKVATTNTSPNNAASDDTIISVRMWHIGLDVAVPVSPAMFNEGDGKQPSSVDGGVEANPPIKEWRYVVAHVDATLTH